MVPRQVVLEELLQGARQGGPQVGGEVRAKLGVQPVVVEAARHAGVGLFGNQLHILLELVPRQQLVDQGGQQLLQRGLRELEERFGALPRQRLFIVDDQVLVIDPQRHGVAPGEVRGGPLEREGAVAREFRRHVDQEPVVALSPPLYGVIEEFSIGI